MLTKKFRAFTTGGGLAFLILTAAGCSPPGAQALLDGKRLLDKGQPGAAAVRLEEAARSMPTNALVWSYLAVAHHYSGNRSNAEVAYLEALRLNPELVESRFGLGMLHWQQSDWAKAREQFASVTVLQPDRAQAWLRLGECQARLNDVRGALMSLSRATTLDSKSAEAWNWLGMAQVQSQQWRDAERSFERALDLQMNHGPALLNLAILRQQHLDRPREALDLYRQYVAFWPAAANSDEVRSAADELERRLAPVPPPEPSKPVVSPTRPEHAVVPTGPTSPAPGKVASSPSVVSPLSAPPQPVRTIVPQEPQIQSTPVAAPVGAQVAALEPAPLSSAPTGQASATVVPGRRGFFSRLNPLNLFRGEPEAVEAASSVSGADVASQTEGAGPSRAVSTSRPEGVTAGVQYRRYAYRLDVPVARGNQEEALRLSQEAARLRLSGRLTESAATCREAVALEPASYDAQFNLGLILLQSGDIGGALAAFEIAVLLQPQSDAARYNFGLMLRQAGYPVDAVLEMQRLLQRDSADVRAHLMLGNLYDRPFGDKTRARRHYLRVLELAPSHPEAGAIRFWLKENPA